MMTLVRGRNRRLVKACPMRWIIAIMAQRRIPMELGQQSLTIKCLRSRRSWDYWAPMTSSGSPIGSMPFNSSNHLSWWVHEVKRLVRVAIIKCTSSASTAMRSPLICSKVPGSTNSKPALKLPLASSRRTQWLQVRRTRKLPRRRERSSNWKVACSTRSRKMMMVSTTCLLALIIISL